MQFNRFAIYFMPDGSFGTTGAAWLGWDAIKGTEVPFPGTITDIEAHQNRIARPHKYGFHATLKAPFRLSPETSLERLIEDFRQFCTTTQAPRADHLSIQKLGRFFALIPEGESETINQLAMKCLETFEPHRAALTPQELAKRRKNRLTPYQEQMLVKWGYPFVEDAFRFHITLTSPLNVQITDETERELISLFAPLLPSPFQIGKIALVGEREGGLFKVIEIGDLTG